LSAALQARGAAVAAAWAAGVVVVFAAGNGQWGFPGQHPDVISVGGVDLARDGSLRASDYASGFISNVYPGRRVPDVSGLVGMQPRAQSIMLPVPEGSTLDSALAGGNHPNGDETAADDGWAAFSGTSAAAPQVAGVCALIGQACPQLGPDQVRDVLMRTARDVTTGMNHPNFGIAAVVGPDAATGNGLVDADRATLVAKQRCLSLPVQRIQPPLRSEQPVATPARPAVTSG
jgi:subtilisin family serine protease